MVSLTTKLSYISFMCLHITTVLPLPLERQTCAAAAWHSSVRVSLGQRLSPSLSSWQAVALCRPEKPHRIKVFTLYTYMRQNMRWQTFALDSQTFC